MYHQSANNIFSAPYIYKLSIMKPVIGTENCSWNYNISFLGKGIA